MRERRRRQLNEIKGKKIFINFIIHKLYNLIHFKKKKRNDIIIM